MFSSLNDSKTRMENLVICVFLFCCQFSLMYVNLCSLRRLTVDIYRKGSVVSVIRKICIYISVQYVVAVVWKRRSHASRFESRWLGSCSVSLVSCE